LEEYDDLCHNAPMKQEIAKQTSLLGKTVFSPAQRSGRRGPRPSRLFS
jgi:hypothetical protein